MDRGTDFGDSAPDWIPDGLLAEFQHRAAREVKRSRRAAKRGRALTPFRSGDVWFAGLIVFCGLVIALSLVGAVVYATVLWPRISLLVIAPALTLFAMSLLIARITKSRWRSWTMW